MTATKDEPFSYGIAEGSALPKNLWVQRHAFTDERGTQTVEFIRSDELERLVSAIDAMRALMDKLWQHGPVMGDDARAACLAFNNVIKCLGEAYTEKDGE